MNKLIVPIVGSAMLFAFTVLMVKGGETSTGSGFTPVLALNSKAASLKSANQSTIHGQVVRYKQADSLVIDDGQGNITVTYSDKWLPLNVRVGEWINVSGQVKKSGSTREIQASEIYAGAEQIYPPEGNYNNIMQDDGLSPFLADSRREVAYSDRKSTSPSGQQLMLIREATTKTPNGEMVEVEGEVFELPDRSLMLIRDGSGQLLVDIDDAQDTLNLKKGDKVSVKGRMNKTPNGSAQLEALQIEKN